MKHPDELTLGRMVDGELPPDRVAATRSHLVDCASCQASWEALKSETEILRAVLREDDEPLPAAFREKDSLGWLLAAAVVAGALGISSLWSRFVEPVVNGMDRVGLGGESLFTTILIRSLLYRGWTEMASTVTEVALLISLLVSLTAIAIWSWRRVRASAMAFALGALLFALPGGAEAAVIELDRATYVLPKDERLENDLIVAAEIVRIEGILAGDLIVAARLVEVSGSVEGDVLGFAESIDVTGEVRGNVRTGSRVLNLDGVVERNVTSAGETIRLRSGGRVGGSFTAAGRETIVSAPIERDLLAAAQTHEIGSRVGGSALLAGERLVVGPGASVAGSIRFYGANEPDVSPEAQLASPVEFEKVEDGDEDRSPFAWLGHFVFFWAAAFVLGTAFVLLAPGTTEAVTTVHMPSYAKSALAGLLSLGAVVALSGALLLTLVGIPLGLVTLFAGCTALYAAQVYAGVYIGKRLLGLPMDRSQLIVRLAVGLLAIHILKNIPFVGPVVTAVVALWGFGSLTLWFLESVARPPRQSLGGAEVNSGG